MAKDDIARLLLMSSQVMADILDLIEPEIAPFKLSTPKTLPLNETRKSIRRPVPEILSFEMSKMAAGGNVGFGATANRSN